MNWFTLIFKYLGAALQILSIVQTVIPTAPGPVKKAVAMSLLAQPNPTSNLSELIDTLVTGLTAGGAWQKDKAPVAGLVQGPV